MVIENMQQTIELLKNIKDFFFNIDETEKRLNTELYNKEGERDDLLHEIELSKLNAIERMQTYSKLETVLKETLLFFYLFFYLFCISYFPHDTH